MSTRASRIGNNIQFLTQKAKNHAERTFIDGSEKSVHMFNWSEDAVGTPSVYWETDVMDAGYCVFHYLEGSDKVPEPGNETVAVNLWVNNEAPQEENLREIVLRSFNYYNPEYVDTMSNINDIIRSEKSLTAIRLKEGEYAQKVIFDQAKIMFLEGGWNSDFSAQSSFSTICGQNGTTIEISAGSLTLENIVLK